MSLRSIQAVFFSVIFAFITSATLLAQNTASLSGTVEDSSGRVVVSAHVLLLDRSGHKLQETLTTALGAFEFHHLAAGAYELRIISMGFAPLRKSISAGSQESSRLVLQLRPATTHETVTVHEPDTYKVIDAGTGTKMDLPLMETPVNVAVIPQQLIQDQQTVNLTDALVNVSGVAPTNDSYNTSDSFSIRGFDSAALLYQDGMKLNEYSDSGFMQDIANVEQIEIVKGPASVLYGQGEPGGLVNVVLKKPRPEQFFNAQQQFGGHSYFRTTGDFNQPFDNSHLMARLVFDGLDAGSFRNFIHTNSFEAFPSLRWSPSKTLDLTIQGSYQFGSGYTDNGIPYFATYVPNTPIIDNEYQTQIVAIGKPVSVPISSNFVDSGANWGRTHQFDIKPTALVHLSPNWTLRLIYKYFFITAPSALDEVYAGNVDQFGNLGRYAFISPYFHHKTDQVTGDLIGKFNIANLKNNFLIGFDFNKDFGAYSDNGACPATINVYAPVYNQPIDYSPNCFLYGYGWNTLGYLAYGAYIQDLVELPHHIFLMGGLRMNWAYSFENYYFPDPTSDFVTNVHDRPLNPRAGLLWQPNQHISLYGDYSSNYGDSSASTPSPGQKFLPPQSAEQAEFGIKTEWLNKRLTASSAVYRIIKHNVPVPDPSNPLITIPIGTDRTQGVEFDLTGQLTNDLRVIASYAYQPSRITNDPDCLTSPDPNVVCDGIPSEQGLEFPAAPHFTHSIWATWEPHQGPFKGLRLGGGVHGHAGESGYQTFFDANYNPLGLEADQIPATASVNLMSGYRHNWGRALISAQLNIINLANRHYFENINSYGGQAQPASPFNVMPTIEIKF